MDPLPSGLGRGERAPDFVLPLQDGTPTRFLCPRWRNPRRTALLAGGPDPAAAALRHHARPHGRFPLAIFAVQHGRPDAALQTPFPVFFDAQGTVKAAYRLGHTMASTCVVLSPNLQVLATLAVQDFAATASPGALYPCSRPAPIAPLEIHTQAPVLLIPRVLTPEICHTLIHVWETRGHAETGVEHSHNRQRQDSIHHSQKSRQDHIVSDRSCCGSSPPPLAGGSSPKCTKPSRFRRRGLKDSKSPAMPPPPEGFFTPTATTSVPPPPTAGLRSP